MAKKALTQASAETLEPRLYEIGYLLSPAVRDEDLAARIDALKESLTKLGATIFAEGNAEFIDLAYEMARVIDNKRVRYNQAYFGWIKIEVDPAQMNAIKEVLDKNIDLIRYLLITTTRENTIIGKRPLGKILKAGKRESVNEGDTAIKEDAPEVADDAVADDVIADEIAPETADESVAAETDTADQEIIKE